MASWRFQNCIPRSSACAAVVLLAQAIDMPAHAVQATAAGAAQSISLAPLQEVVVTAPLLGSEVPLDEVAASIQRISAREINRLAARDVSDALNQLDGSISLNDTQGNPFQEDLDFRGFTASPVLGTPEGVSVYVDGVRVNEAFGDAVNWDLIPSSAISSIEVIPGANPIFGLNTLGGAVSITTRNGFDDAGTDAEVYGGSFGRRAAEIDTGGHHGHLGYFLSGTLFDENGWGHENPTRVRQGFGKVGYRDGGNDVSLALTYADNRLQGNQTLPLSFLSDPWQSYSWPDIQTNQLVFLDLNGRHRLSDDWTFTGKAYFRRVSTDVFNSNVNGNYDPMVPIGPGNEPTGNVIEGIDQYRPGAALQLAGHSSLAGHRNTLIAGASLDPGWTDYRQFNQEAGAYRDTISTAPAVLGTLLHAVNRYSGAYFSDTLGLTHRLFLDLAGSYNHEVVRLEDRLGTALNGHDTYDRFDPSVGITFSPTGSLTLYATYDQGMRAPTPMELTCADPDAPCNLPNAFSADPPLKAVVAKNIEFGARGALGSDVTFTASIFRTNLDDDIQFVSSGGGAVSSGFFENVGQTRRQGAELGLDGRAAALSFRAHYSYVEATFQTPLVLNSPDNSTAAPLTCLACTDIQVLPGDRIPGIPRHVVKLNAAYEVGALTLDVDLIGQSDLYARGDENNRDVNGPIPGFLLINLDARYALSSRWHLFARIDNLLDRRYYTYGVLGRNVFTAPGDVFDATGATWRSEQFRTVGVPIGAWIGVQYNLDGSQHGGT
jgi:iron complex outermembrane receptor protein